MPGNLISSITLPNNETYSIKDSEAREFISNSPLVRMYRTITGTAAVTADPYYCSRWDVTDETITEYTDGMVVCLKVPIAGNETYGTGFQINNLGYKPVVYNVNSMVSTRYGVNSVVWAVYNSTQTGSLYLNSGSASTVTGCWQVNDYSEKLYIEKTYSQLISLISNNELVPGQKYRITDYVTTTTQTNTTSANHAFDLVVTATDTNKLDCMAQALPHSGDTYFSTAGANLTKWQVWYDINNDTTKYVWADTTNGKGVIYRLIDEWGNDCPYDFKNIQFKRKLTDGVLDTASGTNTWVYTFNLYDQEDSTQYDASVSQFVIENDEGGYTHTYGNIIKRYGYGEDNNGTSYGYPYQLNDIVFCNYREDGDNFYGCYSNTFGNNCRSNTFGNYCYNNTFGDYCYTNTFGRSCYSNTFGNDCSTNVFGNECYSNTFGDYCYSNTFGDYCRSNTFGNYCYNNTFGDYCYTNTFGESCNHIIFGNSSNQGGTYCRYNIVENGNQYIRLYQTTGSNNKLQNVYIAQGVNNTTTYINISTIARNLSYRTTVAKLSNGTIRIYKEDEDDSIEVIDLRR